MWIECEQTSVGLVLEQVIRKLRHRKFVRSFGEIDRAVCADVEVVQAAKLHAVSFLRQYFYFARFVDGQQTLDRICNNQISFTIEDQPEGTTMRFGKDTRLSSVRLKDHDPAVFETSVNFSFGIERNVLWLVPVTECKPLHGCELRVLRVLAGQCRRSRRSPCRRGDWHRRQKKVCKRDNDDEEDDECEALFKRHQVLVIVRRAIS